MLNAINEDYEIVYTVTEYWDGPRRGAANYQGMPHFYESLFDEQADEWSDIFVLAPIDKDKFVLVLEDWERWKRWKQAWRIGQAPSGSHPALPEDKVRYEQLAPILANCSEMNIETAIKVKAHFKQGQEGEPISVRWFDVKE